MSTNVHNLSRRSFFTAAAVLPAVALPAAAQLAFAAPGPAAGDEGRLAVIDGAQASPPTEIGKWWTEHQALGTERRQAKEVYDEMEREFDRRLQQA